MQLQICPKYNLSLEIFPFCFWPSRRGRCLRSAAVREIDRSLQPFTVAALHELVVTLILPSEEGKYLNLCLIRLLISKKSHLRKQTEQSSTFWVLWKEEKPLKNWPKDVDLVILNCLSVRFLKGSWIWISCMLVGLHLITAVRFNWNAALLTFPIMTNYHVIISEKWNAMQCSHYYELCCINLAESRIRRKVVGFICELLVSTQSELGTFIQIAQFWMWKPSSDRIHTTYVSPSSH